QATTQIYTLSLHDALPISNKNINTPMTLSENKVESLSPNPASPMIMVKIADIKIPIAKLPPSSCKEIPSLCVVITRVKIIPHHKPDCPSIMARLCPKNACTIHANPVTKKERCNRFATSSPDILNAEPIAIGMTTILAKIKNNHCNPEIQCLTFHNSFMFAHPL